jgi:hypothetical protein
MDKLSADIVDTILDFLDVKSAYNLGRTCKFIFHRYNEHKPFYFNILSNLFNITFIIKLGHLKKMSDIYYVLLYNNSIKIKKRTHNNNVLEVYLEFNDTSNYLGMIVKNGKYLAKSFYCELYIEEFTHKRSAIFYLLDNLKCVHQINNCISLSIKKIPSSHLIRSIISSFDSILFKYKHHTTCPLQVCLEYRKSFFDKSTECLSDNSYSLKKDRMLNYLLFICKYLY